MIKYILFMATPIVLGCGGPPAGIKDARLIPFVEALEIELQERRIEVSNQSHRIEWAIRSNEWFETNYGDGTLGRGGWVKDYKKYDKAYKYVIINEAVFLTGRYSDHAIQAIVVHEWAHAQLKMGHKKGMDHLMSEKLKTSELTGSRSDFFRGDMFREFIKEVK